MGTYMLGSSWEVVARRHGCPPHCSGMAEGDRGQGRADKGPVASHAPEERNAHLPQEGHSL